MGARDRLDGSDLRPAVGIDEGVGAVLELIEGGARCVAIDGLGASGKSTIAERLARLAEVRLVHTDDFTRPGSVGWERERFREQVWTPWRAGEPFRYQRHHWTAQEPTDWVSESAGGTLVLEGIGASEAPRGIVWDAVVWVACAPATRQRRAESRDPGRYGCWSTTWRPIEQEWFERAQPWRGADLVWVNAGV